ncbi:MAG TPA: TlpA disulfide reductase family protein [Pyrinomonadaceae bacterium]|nr:TlpA disulfide reductase family protein [Pyrinomonadaceae bacterium]
MKQILAVFLILCASFLAFAGGDETAPMQEKEFKYKDWTYKNLKDGSSVNLRSFAQGKKLVMVVYFAAWCPNWHNESPAVERLYQKYKDKGFEVIAVSEYDSLEEAKKNVAANKFSFTVVTESESKDAREKTAHYEQRTEAGDTRKWGSPWNVFLETRKLKKDGETLVKKAFVVNGEIIESEVEAFIRQKLGLPAEIKQTMQTAKNKAEICEPVPLLKKP